MKATQVIRRIHSLEFKESIVNRLDAGEAPLDIARETHIQTGTLHRWQREYHKRGGTFSMDNKNALISHANQEGRKPVITQPASKTTETEFHRGQLSKRASYTLTITGEVGRKEMDRLIRIIEAQRAIYDDEEPEAPQTE